MGSISLLIPSSKLHCMVPLFIECKRGRSLYKKLDNPSFYDKLLNPSLHPKTFTRWWQVTQGESFSQHLHYMTQKYEAQIYSTWPKYKPQIILNYSKQFIQFRRLLLVVIFFPKSSLHGCIRAWATGWKPKQTQMDPIF